jgi:hypothetical protein
LLALLAPAHRAGLSLATVTPAHTHTGTHKDRRNKRGLTKMAANGAAEMY